MAARHPRPEPIDWYRVSVILKSGRVYLYPVPIDAEGRDELLPILRDHGLYWPSREGESIDQGFSWFPPNEILRVDFCRFGKSGAAG